MPLPLRQQPVACRSTIMMANAKEPVAEYSLTKPAWVPRPQSGLRATANVDYAFRQEWGQGSIFVLNDYL